MWSAGRKGDRALLENLTVEGIRAGIRPIDMLFGFAGPFLVKIGELWACGDLTVSDEHSFTYACEGVIDVISEKTETEFNLGKGLDGNSSGVLANIPGNDHHLGLRFVKLALASEGVKTSLLTKPASVEQILDKALSEECHFIGLSISMPSQLESLEKCLMVIDRESSFTGSVIVGGGAVKRQEIIKKDAFRLDIKYMTNPNFDKKEIQDLIKL